MEKLVAGMDLHSDNVVIGIMDLAGQRVAHGKVDWELPAVEQFLAPYRSRLEQVAVESTFNWYWLVDGLQAKQYPVVLANPARMDQDSGLKHGDDTSDAFCLAELLRLKILPTGHIYDVQLRPVRDRLRRRVTLVEPRTAPRLRFKSLYTRTTGKSLTLTGVRQMQAAPAQKRYAHPANQLAATLQLEQIESLNANVDRLKKAVLGCARELPIHARLTTLPGGARFWA